MSTTIAVTLITAISTLSGAGISGYVAYLISRTQNNSQLEIARNQQLEQRLQGRGQIRRDVYLQYLNQIGAVESVLDGLWRRNLAGVDTNDGTYENSITNLRRAKDVVVLEGPAAVSDLASKLWMKCDDEFLTIQGLVKVFGKVDQEASLLQKDLASYRNTASQRSDLKHKFIAAAQTSVDELLSSTTNPTNQKASP